MKIKISETFKIILIFAIALGVAIPIIWRDYAQAIVVTSPPRLIQTNDVTGAMILDRTITGMDIASSTDLWVTNFNVSNFTATNTLSLPTGSITSAFVANDSILNEDINSSAAIADTKLAQITTAGKVSGAALTNLANIPAGAGIIPSANAPGASYISTLISAGDYLNTGSAVFVNSGTTTYLTLNAAQDNEAAFGHDTATATSSQSFILTEQVAIGGVTVFVRKEAAPADNALFSIQGDSGGSPDGVKIVSLSIVGSTLSATLAAKTLYLPFTSATASTTYWIVAERDGAKSGTNFYFWATMTANPYANGLMKAFSAGSWSADATRDIYAVVLGANMERVWKTSAVASTTALTVGFAKAATATSSTATIIVNGLINVFSGLTTGANYFLGNASGTISTVKGTGNRWIGRAIATTTLLFVPNFE